MDTGKVTKQFYDRFKKERNLFIGFITGISNEEDKAWYASLMLNRLMFCYFLQKKGLLGQDQHYLDNKLKLHRSFYRNFLLILFHEGLHEPAQKQKVKTAIGKVPCLGGSLFGRHELEQKYKIAIPDKAFEHLFVFFDRYEWRLHTAATGKEINPDVIGYIFEKHINDRAQMGAYYTKEDITHYISKNCIIPWLLEETARHHPAAFAKEGKLWQALRAGGDKYIYDAVKYGINIPLPKQILAGIDNTARRTGWNKPCPATIGLPTETWREVVERRKHYEDVKTKIETGQLESINDLISYNLDIQQFVLDIIQNSDDPVFLRAFYTALTGVTIIDPTCGSGAFLIAAMNILEPLYHACLMKRGATGEVPGNLHYFIYKTIVLNNLYGVDIMKEAVEIAKLRLLLKLITTVEPDYTQHNHGLEPLSDIDFNIRAGNALSGFVSREALNGAAPAIGQNNQPFHWFAAFHEIVGRKGGFDIIIGNPPYVEYAKVRKEYSVNGFATEKCGNLYAYVIEQSTKLLHQNGNIGFIIPLSGFCTLRMKPLVQLYKNNKRNTWISHFGWRPATLFEGVNIPLSIAISTAQRSAGESKLYVTEFYKWYREKRAHVLNLLNYNEAGQLLLHDFVFPKIGPAYNSIFEKLLSVGADIGSYTSPSPNNIFYRNTGGLYWRIIIDFEPKFILHGKKSSSSTLATLSFHNKEQVQIFTAVLNSNLFWLYYVGYSSFHHVNPIDLTAFPISLEKMDAKTKKELIALSGELMKDMKKNSVLQTRVHKRGNNSQSQTFYPSRSKPVVDKIDLALARYFQFTDEELDRVINYDIKFRLQEATESEA